MENPIRQNKKLIALGLVILLLIQFLVMLWTTREREVSLEPDGPGEKIISIDSQVRLREDGTILVSEKITFLAELRAIRRGLYRTLPLVVKDRIGESKISYTLTKASYEGNEIALQATNSKDFYMIQLKQENPPITEGRHWFDLEYEAKGFVQHFKEYDRFVFPVTGSWTLPVLGATTVIYLPGFLAARDVIVKGYTGTEEIKQQNFKSDSPREDLLRFWTTAPLLDSKEFKIELRIPTGFIKASATPG